MAGLRSIGALALGLAGLLACGPSDLGFSKGSTDQDFQDGVATMELSEETLRFEDVVPGTARSIDLVLRNAGDADLLVYEGEIVSDPAQVFYAEAEASTDLVVVPEQEVALTIGVTLEEAERADGVYRLDTNDPERPTFEVALVALPEGWEGETGAVD